MGRTSKILGADGRPYERHADAAPRSRPRPGARYDAAQTTDNNKRHWAAADALSARAANNPGVRRTLRNRSRYERANNGYAAGLVLTLANDLFGTGPRLQVQTEDRETNRRVEFAFHAWAEAVGLTETLITGKQAKTGDGEWIGLLAAEQVADEPVHLDLVAIETEQCATPPQAMPANPAAWVDGIELDRRGRPQWYHILKEHPGDTFTSTLLFADFERLPARQVLHWFRKDRPGQARGVPEITPGLPLCAQLRRWTLATLSAAEAAADMAVLLTSKADSNPDDDEDGAADFETFPIERGLMMALPAGADAKQMKAEHPGQQYGPFKGEILQEFGRPVSAPANLVKGSSAEYNYSSARMDHLLYRAAMRVEREGCRRSVLDRTFAAWYAEGRLIPGYLSDGATLLPERLPHAWYWPGFEAIDPLKEALADTERLSNGTTTLQELLAEYGQDWEVFLRQRARERDLMLELGLPLPAWLDPSSGKPPAATNADGTTGPPPEARRRRDLIAAALELDRRTNGAYLNGDS